MGQAKAVYKPLVRLYVVSMNGDYTVQGHKYLGALKPGQAMYKCVADGMDDFYVRAMSRHGAKAHVQLHMIVNRKPEVRFYR